MEKVLGIGGVFLRAKDPVALAAWYQKHLGLEIQEGWNGAIFPLRNEADRAGAYVVWSAFEPGTDYFGARENAAMVNFRVRDLDAMRKQLLEAGCDVDPKVDSSDFGKFGWVTDPEGRRIELWEPPETPPKG